MSSHLKSTMNDDSARFSSSSFQPQLASHLLGTEQMVTSQPLRPTSNFLHCAAQRDVAWRDAPRLHQPLNDPLPMKHWRATIVKAFFICHQQGRDEREGKGMAGEVEMNLPSPKLSFPGVHLFPFTGRKGKRQDWGEAEIEEESNYK